MWREDKSRPAIPQRPNAKYVRNFTLKAIKFLAALLLLPFFPPTFWAIWRLTRGLNERTLFLENPLSLCLGGVILWAIFSTLFRLPTRIYIFAHEMTHALFVRLCGGSVKRISVKEDRGFVLSDRTNFLIVLSPYIFPFYAILIGLLALGGALAFPLAKFEILLWTGIGVCLGYHWTMTFKMMRTCQSDFSSQGHVFSFVFIAWCNLLWILFLLVLLPSPTGCIRKIDSWGEGVVQSYQICLTWILHWISP